MKNKTIIIPQKINGISTNTSKILSDIPFFNISDLEKEFSNTIFRPLNLNIPRRVGIVNLDNGREAS
jgi:hypothetical protein